MKATIWTRNLELLALLASSLGSLHAPAQTSMPDTCGQDVVKIPSSPYDLEAVRKQGVADVDVKCGVVAFAEALWESLPDCPGCGVPGACAAYAVLDDMWYEVVPHSSEPDVLVRCSGGTATIGCTAC